MSNNFDDKKNCDNFEVKNKRNNLKNNNKIDYEGFTIDELAPEGGWGYFVAIAMIIVFVSKNIH